jgi:hypothetical protein
VSGPAIEHVRSSAYRIRAYSRRQALAMANGFAPLGVIWLEEPLSSSDLDGLRLIRGGAPAGIDVTAGEYGSEPGYFRRMLEAEAVAARTIGRLIHCVIHCEYFRAHARAVGIPFDGVLTPENGPLTPDAGRPGLGIELKRADTERFRL